MNRKGIKKWKSKNAKLIQLKKELRNAQTWAAAHASNYRSLGEEHLKTKQGIQAFKNLVTHIYESSRSGHSLKVQSDDFRHLIELLREINIEHRVSRDDHDHGLVEIKSPLEVSAEESLNRFHSRQDPMNFRC